MNGAFGLNELQLDLFLENLAGAIQSAGGLSLQASSRFRDLEPWDSIASISTVAMLYAEYDVQVSGDELVGCDTVEDLFSVVARKLVG
jgi:acyl carrier protein